MRFPFTLVLREKHGDFYYLMTERKDVDSFAIKLLSERFTSPYCYYAEPKPIQDTFEEYFESVYDMTFAAAEELYETHGDNINIGSKTTGEVLLYAKKSYGAKLTEIQEYEYIKTAVKDQDAKLAWKILYNRSMEGYSYEGFDLEQFENRD